MRVDGAPGSHWTGHSPVEVSRALARAVSEGNVEAAAALICEDGCLLRLEGPIRGITGIRNYLERLVEADSVMDVEIAEVARSGDLAVGTGRWEVRRGQLRESAVCTVVYRYSEGAWKLFAEVPLSVSIRS